MSKYNDYVPLTSWILQTGQTNWDKRVLQLGFKSRDEVAVLINIELNLQMYRCIKFMSCQKIRTPEYIKGHRDLC